MASLDFRVLLNNARFVFIVACLLYYVLKKYFLSASIILKVITFILIYIFFFCCMVYYLVCIGNRTIESLEIRQGEKYDIQICAF
jgi:hypothetical protein